MTPEELDDLILGSLAGTLPEEDRRRLEARLAEDAEAARRFAELALQEGLLREIAGAERPAVPRAARGRHRAFRRSPEGGVPGWLWAAAAAVLVSALAILFVPRREGLRSSETARREVPSEAAAPAPEPEAAPVPAPRPPPEPPPVPEAPPPAPKEPPPEPPAPPPPPKPAPEVERPATREMRAAVARIENVRGAVEVLEGAERTAAKEGQDLLAGQGVETAGKDGAAALKFPDGTRLELAPGTTLPEVWERGEGKRARLARGTLSADVPRQPAGRPLAIITPQAEARVLGTRFALRVEGESTRIEVREGKVRLTRQGGLAAADVAAGHFAVAAPGTPLASKPLPPEVVRVSFGPADAPLPPDFTGDDGSPWDDSRGRGWSRDRRAHTRLRPGPKEALLRRHISAGDSKTVDRWEIRLEEGKYHVAVFCGDAQRAQGPHRVTVEGRPLIRDLFTGAGEQARGEAIVEVRDGRLTFEFGALGSVRTDPEGDSDTVLQYVVITRLW